MLLNDAAVTSTVEAFLSADPKPGTIFVDCSTVYPDLSEDLSHKAAGKGVLYLTSPIFGRPDAVLAHRGLLVSAGDPAARERVRCSADPVQYPMAGSLHCCSKCSLYSVFCFGKTTVLQRMRRCIGLQK